MLSLLVDRNSGEEESRYAIVLDLNSMLSVHAVVLPIASSHRGGSELAPWGICLHVCLLLMPIHQSSDTQRSHTIRQAVESTCCVFVAQRSKIL
jgi:hypothetical protein